MFPLLRLLLLLPIVSTLSNPLDASELTVFSTHPGNLHFSNTSPSGPSSESISLTSATSLLAALSAGSVVDAGSSPLPVSLDMFTRSEYNLLLTLPSTSQLPAPGDYHDHRTYVVPSLPSSFESTIGSLPSRTCAGSTSSLYCPSKTSSKILTSTPSSSSSLLSTLGVTVGEEVASSPPVLELVGLITSVTTSKPSSKKCNFPSPKNLIVSAAPEGSEPELSAALDALQSHLLTVLKARNCGSTVSVIRYPSSSSFRVLSASAATFTSTPGNNSTSGYTPEHIQLYQITLWTGIAFLLIVIAMALATGMMATNMDPILLANFKADLGDGKYD